jgi:hypothetical protein
MDAPSLEQLLEWQEEAGGCEASDGCWVEPDGRCEHGEPSWPLARGPDLAPTSTGHGAGARTRNPRQGRTRPPPPTPQAPKEGS